MSEGCCARNPIRLAPPGNAPISQGAPQQTELDDSFRFWRKPQPHFLVSVVSVVVVVTGLDTVVCSADFVVVLVVVGLAQPDSDTRAATTRQGRISFFISIIVVWIVTTQPKSMVTSLVGQMLWGVDLPHANWTIAEKCLVERKDSGFKSLSLGQTADAGPDRPPRTDSRPVTEISCQLSVVCLPPPGGTAHVLSGRPEVCNKAYNARKLNPTAGA